MGILLTASVLFLLSLVLPAFASADDPPKKKGLPAFKMEDWDPGFATEQRLKARRKELEERKKIEREPENLEKRSEERRKKRIEDLQQEQAELAAHIELLKQEKDATEELEAAQRQAEIVEARLALAMAKNTEEIEKAALALKKLEQAHKKLDEASSIMKSYTKDIGNMLGITTDLNTTMVGSFVTMIKKSGGLKKAIVGLQVEMNKMFTVGNLLNSAIAKFVQASVAVAISQDQARSDFIRATGASGEYVDMITRVYDRTSEFGVTSGEAGQALSGLYAGMSVFTRLLPETQEELAATVALMSEYGVSIELSARALDFFTRSMVKTQFTIRCYVSQIF